MSTRNRPTDASEPSHRRPAPSRPTDRRAHARLLLVALAGSLLLSACVTVTRQEEIAMGRQYAEQINRELPLVEDSAVVSPIAEAGLELARLSPRPDLPYEFHVVNTDVVNAFAVPGGFIYMNRGLIADAEKMSEVAGVLAHEVAHVVARHSAEQIERARRAQLGLIGATVILGEPGELARLGVNVAGNLYFSRHSREDESEADSLAVHLMVDAGWHPSGLVSFFHTMMENRESKPGALEALFTSHPLTEDRIREVEALIASLPPGRMEGLRDDSAGFGELKAALERLPPPPEKFRAKEKEEPSEPDTGEERDPTRETTPTAGRADRSHD